MQVPLQVTFENIEHSDAIEACINDDWKKLEPFSDGITSARVVVGRPQHRHHKGDSTRYGFILRLPAAPISSSTAIPTLRMRTTTST